MKENRPENDVLLPSHFHFSCHHLFLPTVFMSGVSSFRRLHLTSIISEVHGTRLLLLFSFLSIIFSIHWPDALTHSFPFSSSTSISCSSYFNSVLQVRTLFVSGLPMDAKPRELYLLFRAYKVSQSVKDVMMIHEMTKVADEEVV